jgi:hypothetical protein
LLPTVVLLVVFGLAGDAHATLRPYATGTGLVSDGRRWAFWHDAAGVRVFDDARGRAARMRGLGECGYRGWKVTDVQPRTGLAVLACTTAEASYGVDEEYAYRVFVPGDRAARPRKGADPTDDILHVGRRWAEGLTYGEESRDTLSVLVNWRTGEREVVADECYDLDAVRPRPLRDCPHGSFVQRDGEYRLRYMGEPQVTGDHLDLFRGSRHVARLHRGSCGRRVGGFCSPQIGGGWVTFARHREVVAYDVTSRRTRRWRAQVRRVVHTRRNLFTARGTTIRRARL